jgi:imidazolonepropionase-like amidohydrolase
LFHYHILERNLVKFESIIAGTIALVVTLVPLSYAADKELPQILFKNVNVFNGTDNKLYENHHVLIEGNLIKAISAGEIQVRGDATVIDGGERTLMPGLIDTHSHLCVQDGLAWGRDNWDQMTMGALTHLYMLDALDQGFTTTRDAGCNTLGLAKAQRQGMIGGPRIFSSGGWLSQTGGHADLGRWNDLYDAAPDILEAANQNYVVDGLPQALKAARHVLRAGGTQIKVMAGGGVSSEFDPLHTTQFSEEELRAIVGVAEDYGTYVMVHAYHDRSVNRAIDAGVKVIEHGFLISEETVKRMAEEGVWWSLQAEMSFTAFAEPEKITFFSDDQKKKASQVHNGVVQVAKWMRKYKVKTATGADMFGKGYSNRWADNVIAAVNGLGYSNFEALQMTTKHAAEMLYMAGEMNPWREAPMGVIEKGAWGDVILVDGNPLEDIEALKRERIKLVVQGGKIYKDSL